MGNYKGFDSLEEKLWDILMILYWFFFNFFIRNKKFIC